MANVFSSYWAQIRGVISATWTDVQPSSGGGGIHRAVSIQKLDWQAAGLNADGTGRPYAVVMYRASRWPSAALRTKVYEVDTEIFYIAPDSAQIAAAIDVKLADLEDALITYDFPDGVQFLDEGMTHDNTEQNAANRVFLELNVPFSAGSLRCRFLAGEQPVIEE